MTAQLLPNLLYVGLMLVALLIPYGSARLEARDAPGRWGEAIVLATALGLTILRLGVFSVFSLILLVPLVRSGLRAILGGLAAVLLFAPVTWWDPIAPTALIMIAVFVALALAASYLPLADSEGTDMVDRGLLLPLGLCLIGGLAVGLLTAPFASADPLYLAWHHWGAYIAPVEAWLAGGAPYRDFPVQYGLGPTALIAATCAGDCWRGLYITTVAANALYFALLAGCTLLVAGRSRALRWLALAALFCACFIWTAFPSNLGNPVMTPSVAGLRFLPIAALLFHILRAERSSTRRDWIGHLIWLVDLFWSPEAAFFGTAIWWPYLALRDACAVPTRGEAILTLLRGAARGAIALTAGLAALVFVVWLLSRQAASLQDFLAYILHPPGPLPINLGGTVWLALSIVVLALQRLSLLGRSAPAPAVYACLIAFLAAGTYFLSRSHDNNILNLFPLLIPPLLSVSGEDRVKDRRTVDFSQAFGRTVLAAMIAFMATVNMWPWIDGGARDGLFRLGSGRLIARFTPHAGDDPAILSRNAVAGLSYLRARSVPSVVLFDDRKIMPWQQAGEGWTSVNNLANFEPLPRSMTMRYIQRGAATYRKSGWLLIDERKYGAWLAMFRTAYDVREHVRFGNYSAYRLVPRDDGRNPDRSSRPAR